MGVGTLADWYLSEDDPWLSAGIMELIDESRIDY